MADTPADTPADEAEERIYEFVETFGSAGFFEDGMIRSLEVMWSWSSPGFVDGYGDF